MLQRLLTYETVLKREQFKIFFEAKVHGLVVLSARTRVCFDGF